MNIFAIVPLVAGLAFEAPSPLPSPKPETWSAGRVVSVDAPGRRVEVQLQEKQETLTLVEALQPAMSWLQAGQEVRFVLQEKTRAIGFVITGPKALSRPDPLVVPEVLPLPATTRQATVLAVDQPGKRVALVAAPGEPQTLTLEGVGARTVGMIDPGEGVLFYLKDPSTAVAFVITGWPARN
jgi:hypothetical protein